MRSLAPIALAFVALPQSVVAAEAPILAHMVEKGELLSVSDFTVEERREAQARGALSPSEVVGKEARRRLQAGAVVRTADIVEPQLVRRGEPVSIIVRDGGLSITGPGRALSSGAAGELVRVVSTATNRTLDGVVEGSGQVRVGSR